MDVALEMEDDLFFADLSKQISLLIMDEDEDPVSRYPSISQQAYSRVIHPPIQSPYIYGQACRIQSKGTGVFIPKSSQPTRRKTKQGRFNSYKSKSYNHPDNTKGISQISYNNSSNSNKCQD